MQIFFFTTHDTKPFLTSVRVVEKQNFKFFVATNDLKTFLTSVRVVKMQIFIFVATNGAKTL
jgi:hypothetical protein